MFTKGRMSFCMQVCERPGQAERWRRRADAEQGPTCQPDARVGETDAGGASPPPTREPRSGKATPRLLPIPISYRCQSCADPDLVPLPHHVPVPIQCRSRSRADPDLVPVPISCRSLSRANPNPDLVPAPISRRWQAWTRKCATWARASTCASASACIRRGSSPRSPAPNPAGRY